MNEPTSPIATVIETAPAAASAPPGTAPRDSKLTKLVIAVHGIGKQYRYATIQSVAGRFGAYAGHRIGTPLGSFHTSASCWRFAATLKLSACGRASVFSTSRLRDPLNAKTEQNGIASDGSKAQEGWQPHINNPANQQGTYP